MIDFDYISIFHILYVMILCSYYYILYLHFTNFAEFASHSLFYWLKIRSIVLILPKITEIVYIRIIVKNYTYAF